MLHAAIYTYIFRSLLIYLQLTDYQLLFFCKITFNAVAIRIKVHAGTIIMKLSYYECVNDYIFYCFLQVQSCGAMQWLKCAGVVARCAAQCAQGASSQTCTSCMGASYNQCKGCPSVIKEIQQLGKFISTCMCMCYRCCAKSPTVQDVFWPIPGLHVNGCA